MWRGKIRRFFKVGNAHWNTYSYITQCALPNEEETRIPQKSRNIKTPSVNRIRHGLINYTDIKAKCRHLKKFTCKGISYGNMWMGPPEGHSVDPPPPQKDTLDQLRTLHLCDMHPLDGAHLIFNLLGPMTLYSSYPLRSQQTREYKTVKKSRAPSIPSFLWLQEMHCCTKRPSFPDESFKFNPHKNGPFGAPM